MHCSSVRFRQLGFIGIAALIATACGDDGAGTDRGAALGPDGSALDGGTPGGTAGGVRADAGAPGGGAAGAGGAGNSGGSSAGGSNAGAGGSNTGAGGGSAGAGGSSAGGGGTASGGGQGSDGGTPAAAARVDNPYANATGYVNPEWKAKASAEPSGERIANTPTAVWLDRIAAIEGTANSQSNGPMGRTRSPGRRARAGRRLHPVRDLQPAGPRLRGAGLER